MTLLGKKLAVAIPDTVLEERDSLREKTVKLGTVARGCAIYGVDFVIIYRDEKVRGEGAFIGKILEYLDTPQYIRKRLFSLDGALRFAGLLPPLRTPSHKAKVPLDKLALGEIREGVTNSDGTVDIGLDKQPRFIGKAAPQARVTVRIRSKSPLEAEQVSREQVNEYWGYKVESRTLEEVFDDPRFAVKIATSRFGNTLQSQLYQLREAILKAPSLSLIFGSPSRGLFEMAGRELSEGVDFVVNLFPEQHVQTVRTEEALVAGLGLVSTLAV